MNLVVLHDAEREASQAAKWYEAKQVNLGSAFLDELEVAFRAIEADPTSLPFLESNESATMEFRRVLLTKFPYLVIFTIRDEDILVVAVAHAHRKPDYWAERID